MIENAYVEFLNEYDQRKILQNKTQKIEAIMKQNKAKVKNDEEIKKILDIRKSNIKQELLSIIMSDDD